MKRSKVRRAGQDEMRYIEMGCDELTVNEGVKDEESIRYEGW
jgi:hypothetical protein